MAITKYSRQIARARKSIARKGTTCVWFKAAQDVDPADLPEFQDMTEPVQYPGIPIAFYPQSRLNLQTVLAVALTGSYTDQLFAVIPGDLPFTPVQGDKVVVAGQTLHVDTLNATQPDMVPIVWEVSFK